MNLKGFVFDDAGAPVNNITVEASTTLDGSAAGSAVSDADGMWEITDLTAGTPYYVRIVNGSKKYRITGLDKVQLAELDVTGVLIVPVATGPTPTVEGSMAWDSDDDALAVGNGSATLKAHLGAWTDFSADIQIWQGGAGLTKVVNAARYLIIGKTAFVAVSLAPTQAGTPNNAICIGWLPAVLEPKYHGGGRSYVLGTFTYQPASGAILTGNVHADSANAWSGADARVMFIQDTAVNDLGIGAGPTLANGDSIGLLLIYELA